MGYNILTLLNMYLDYLVNNTLLTYHNIIEYEYYITIIIKLYT